MSQEEHKVGEHDEIPEYITHPKKEFATGGIVPPDVVFSEVQLIVRLKQADLLGGPKGPYSLELKFETTGEVSETVLNLLHSHFSSPVGPYPYMIMRLKAVDKIVP